MKNAHIQRRSAKVGKVPTMNMPNRSVARALKGFISGAGTIMGVGIAFIIGIIATVGAASSGLAQPNMPTTVLYPSGDFVDVVLDGVDVDTGESTLLSTANPPDYGFPILEVNENGEEVYLTRDLRAILDALQEGGMILLKPGVYNWNARIVHYDKDGYFDHTSMIQYGGSGYPWASALDYHLRGAEPDAHGPTVKVVCDIFIHFAADLKRETTPTQIVEKIHFDNAEWQEYCYDQGKFNTSNTVLGWRGQADITIKKCKFTGGGVTFHNDGKVTFEKNTMVDTYYGVQVTGDSPFETADTDFFARKNTIETISGAGIWCAFILSKSTPKKIEIVDNDIAWAGFAGAGAWFTDASVLIQHNTITSVPGDYTHFYGYYAGVAAWECMSDVLIKSNTVVGGDDLSNNYGINLAGTSGATVQSNKVGGTWRIPVVLNRGFIFGAPSNSNVLIENKLKKVTTLSGVHYYLLNSDYNEIHSSRACGKEIVVLYEGYNGGSNIVTGADYQIVLPVP